MKDLIEALVKFLEGKGIKSTGFVIQNIVKKDKNIFASIEVKPFLSNSNVRLLEVLAQEFLQRIFDEHVEIIILKDNTGAPKSDKRKVDGVKKVFITCSNKGGVGKSTMAMKLALTLQKNGYKTGLLDGDICGSSIPTMCGLEDYKTIVNGDKIAPVDFQGIKVISMGFLTDTNLPLMWRGPMLTKSLTQLIHSVDWGEVDYLIIDTPPGSSDIHISLFSQIVIDGAILVTLPNQYARQGMLKMAQMIEKFSIEILAVIENMTSKSEGKSQILSDDCKFFSIPLQLQVDFDENLFYGHKNVEPEESLFSELIDKMV